MSTTFFFFFLSIIWHSLINMLFKNIYFIMHPTRPGGGIVFFDYLRISTYYVKKTKATLN